MSNHLSMSSQQVIIELIQQGWSQHRIARELDVDRKTVRRHVRLGMDVELAPQRGTVVEVSKICVGQWR